MNHAKIKYDPDNLKSFDREWLIHRRCKEWWYATGVLFDEENNMYSYQYTLLHINFGVITAKMAMIALTDYKNNHHHYLQAPASKESPVLVTENEASIGSIASAKKTEQGIHIALNHRDFSLDLMAQYGKGAVWHCDKGKLQMGIPGKKQTTLYYSYPNMPTEGTLQLNGKAKHLKGKSWFDKQGGTYRITDARTHWEWFSLRFFDDEEAMLFTFPQNTPPYCDGTLIAKDGSYHRLNRYTLVQTATTTFQGLKWSSGWQLHMEEKEEDYTILPVQAGHMNFAYFEELCTITNKRGELVGYAFAELLPGVLNQKWTGHVSCGERLITITNLFKRVEF